MHAAVPYPALYTLQPPHSFIPEATHGCSFADSAEDQKIRANEEQGHAGSSSSSTSATIATAPATESHSNNKLDNKDAAPSTAPALSPFELLQARLAALNASNDS